MLKSATQEKLNSDTTVWSIKSFSWYSTFINNYGKLELIILIIDNIAIMFFQPI